MKPPRDVVKLSCSVDGCDNMAYARTWCPKHYSRWRKHGDVHQKDPRRGGVSKLPKKKSVTHGSQWTYQALGCRCDICVTETRRRASEWHAANRDRRAAKLLEKQYGLSVERYEQMLVDQKGLCAICSAPPTEGRRLYVDHSHVTGEVRALLCTQCNTGLGMLGDDPDRLMAAAAYLLQFTDVLAGRPGATS
jgi:hypothetical protein